MDTVLATAIAIDLIQKQQLAAVPAGRARPARLGTPVRWKWWGVSHGLRTRRPAGSASTLSAARQGSAR
jgi:hypothetical protein